MADPTYTIPDNPTYTTAIRRLQNSDPVNADTIINPLITAILSNIHAVNLGAVQYKQALTESDDLDTITDSGWYHNRQSAYATDANHYPRSGRAGRLSVWQEGAQTYQQYQEYYAPTTSTYESGKLWWRGRSNTSGWGSWRCASEEGHTHDKRPLTADDDLNGITQSGWYVCGQNNIATIDRHYPKAATCGLLIVYKPSDGTLIMQQYQEYQDNRVPNQQGNLWWRCKHATTWGEWCCASLDGHVHTAATASTSGFMTADMYNNVTASLRFMRALTASDNLNDVTISGIYHNPGNVIATEANNYPRAGVSGMLIVHKYGNMIYQLYQAYNDTSAAKMGNWLAWRGCYSGVWGSWFFAATTDTAVQFKRALVAADDLDAITDSGWYHNTSNANATADKHYPRADAAGRLSVWANGIMVYQQYQEVRTGSAAGSPPLNKLWWRCCYSGTWGAWDCASLDGHVHGASTLTFTPPSGMSATNVQAAISEVFQSASDFKASVAAAVTGKGVQTAANANKATMVANIGQIGSQADVTAEKIAAGYKAYKGNGYITGTMPDKNKVSLAIPVSGNSGGISIPDGYYHNGCDVAVSGLLASNIKQGASMFGVAGTYLAPANYIDLSTAYNTGYTAAYLGSITGASAMQGTALSGTYSYWSSDGSDKQPLRGVTAALYIVIGTWCIMALPTQYQAYLVDSSSRAINGIAAIQSGSVFSSSNSTSVTISSWGCFPSGTNVGSTPISLWAYGYYQPLT